MSRGWTLLVSVVGIAGLTAGCGSGASGSTDGSESIKVALIEPFSGPASYIGEQVTAGWKLAMENFGSSVDGREIELVKYDEKCDPAAAAVAVQSVQTSGAVVVNGPGCSASVLAVQSQLASLQLAHVVIAFAPEVTEKNDDFVWRAGPSDADLNASMAKYIASEHDDDLKLAVIHDSSEYGQGQAETIVSALEEQGVSPLANISFTPNASDFSGEIQRMKSAGVNAVYIGAYPADAGRIVSQSARLGFEPQFYSGVVGQSASFAEADPSATAGTIFSSAFNPNSASSKEFLEQWNEVNSSPPDLNGIGAYYGAVATITALQEAGADASASEINDAFRSISLDAAPYGENSFTETGDLACKTLFTMRLDGPNKFTVLKEWPASC